MGSFNHTAQMVTDLERSKRFYQEVLGFQPWFELSPPDEGVAKLNSLEPPIGAQLVYMVLDGFVLELINFGAEGAMEPYRRRKGNEPGIKHLSFSVDDIEASAKKAVEFGGEVLEHTNLGGVVVIIRDPDGQLVELLSASYRDSLPPKP